MRQPITLDQIDELIEHNLCVVRRADIEALVRTARDVGYDASNESQWAEDDLYDSDVLMALTNWEKEHIEWERDDNR
jgi:hypothetical protein